MNPIKFPTGESMSALAFAGLVAARFAIVLTTLLAAHKSGYLFGSIMVAAFLVLRESIDIAIANAMRAAGLIRKDCPHCAEKDEP